MSKSSLARLPFFVPSALGVISNRSVVAVLLFAKLMVLASMALHVAAVGDNVSTTIFVPCYTAQAYSVTSNNTQFIISGCDGRGQMAYFSTYVDIHLCSCSFGWFNLSVTVVNSVSASVLISATSSMSLVDLSITMNNVTNPSTPSANVPLVFCQAAQTSYTWCMPVLKITAVENFIRPQISLTNIAVLRNVTNVAVIQAWSRMELGRLYFENVTFSSSVFTSVVLNAATPSAMISTNITLKNITAVASGSFAVANTVNTLVFDLRNAVAHASNIVLDRIFVSDDPKHGGSASGQGGLCAVMVAGAQLNTSTMIVKNSMMSMATLPNGIFVMALQSILQQTSLVHIAQTLLIGGNAVTHFVLLDCRSLIHASSVELSQTEVRAVSNSTFISLFSVALNGVSGGSRLKFVDTHSNGYLMYYMATMLSDSAVLVYDSSTSGSRAPTVLNLHSTALYFAAPTRSTVFEIVNLTCHGGKTHIGFASDLDAVSIRIFNSTFLDSYSGVLHFLAPAQVFRLLLTIVNTTVTLLPGTAFLAITGGCTLSNSTFMISVMLDLRNKIPSTTSNWEFLYLENSKMFNASLLSVIVTILSNSSIAGRLLRMSNITMLGNSTVELNALPSLSVMFALAAADSSSLVNISATSIDKSGVTIMIPQMVQWQSAASPQVVEVSAASVANGGQILISGGSFKSLSVIRLGNVTTVPLVRFHQCTFRTGAILRISSLLLEHVGLAESTARSTIVMFGNCTLINDSIVVLDQIESVRRPLLLAHLRASLLCDSTLTLKNIVCGELLSNQENIAPSLLLSFSSGTTLCGSTTVVHFLGINLTSGLMLAADSNTSWLQRDGSIKTRITLIVNGVNAVTRSLLSSLFLSGNVSAGTGIELFMSNSTFYGAGVVALDSLSLLGTASSPVMINVTVETTAFAGTDAFIKLVRNTLAPVAGAAFVNISLSRLNVTARSSNYVSCKHSANCTAIILQSLNGNSALLTLSVALNSLKLIGSLTLLRHNSSPSPQTLKVNVYCSLWGRHEFSPLVMMGPHSGPTAMNSTLTYFNHYLHDPARPCVVPVGNPSRSQTETAYSTLVKPFLTREVQRKVSSSLTLTPDQNIASTLTTIVAPSPPYEPSSSQTRLSTITSDASTQSTIPAPQNSTQTLSQSIAPKKFLVSEVLGEPTTSIAQQFFSSVGAVTIVSGVSSAVSSAVGTALVRTAFTAQLADCAGGSIDSIFSGESDENNLFNLQIGDDESPGEGYRSSLVSVLMIVIVTTMFGATIAVALWLGPCGSIRWRRTLRSATAAAALPGWWLAGPCAAAVGPLLSSGISLASVSTWSTPAVDVVILVVAFATAIMTFSWCVIALLKPTHRGLFVCKSVGPVPTLLLPKKPSRASNILVWLLDGGCVWAVDRLLATTKPTPRIIGTASHVSLADRLYPHLYGSLFTSMKPDHYWHFLLDMSANIAAGILVAVPAMVAKSTNSDHIIVSNACNGALHAVTAVQLLFAIHFVYLRPVAVRWELIAGACMATLGALNALLASIQATSLASDVIEDWGNAVQSFQLAASGLAILCAVSECLLTLLVLKHRRALLSNAFDDDSEVICQPAPTSPSTIYSCTFVSQPNLKGRDVIGLRPLSLTSFSTPPTLRLSPHQNNRLEKLPPLHCNAATRSSRLALEALSVLVQLAAQKQTEVTKFV